MSAPHSDSEFRTYGYIRKVLKELGWNTKNPVKKGSVYTQHEFYQHDSLLTSSLGRKSPENIVLVPHGQFLRYWIIEAKRSHKDLKKALGEAQEYADKINGTSPSDSARFATGIAGSPDESFYVQTCYWNGKIWREVSINDYETTGFLSPDQCQYILSKNDSRSAQFFDDPNRFLNKANAINKTLHLNQIPVGDRAKVMAALLLALAHDGDLQIYSAPRRLIREINGDIEDILKHHGKEEFIDSIQLRLPATEKNHKQYRKAIIETLQHLREMNIRSAINGGDDALGKFYETFLRYANGAKEMGIVLTPRHITKFAVDAVGIGISDRVFDPACGTGGFLVSAMDTMRKKLGDSRKKDYEEFKSNGLFGMDKADDVYSLALVNMIFRGDGKSRMYDGNCFDHEFWFRDGDVFYTMPGKGDKEPQGATRPFSRVLMNPPFKQDPNETAFVDYALRQSKPGALLFAVLPAVAIGGARYVEWRQELLRRHVVKAVIKLDKNIFYPIAESTYALIVKAHTPHKPQGAVFMGVLHDDEHRHRKSKVLSPHEARDNVENMTKQIHGFLLGKSCKQNIPREQILATINPDKDCNFAPEAYLSTGEPRERVDLIDLSATLAKLKVVTESKQRPRSVYIKPQQRLYPLRNFIQREIKPTLKNLKDLPKGNVPVISATAEDNGIAAWKQVSKADQLQDCISISKVHNTKPCSAFWHPYRFGAISTVLLVEPKDEFLEDENAILYLCQSITDMNAWRYDYGRNVLLDEIKVYLPSTRSGEVDMERLISIAEEAK